MTAKIYYTKTDEAPYLATYSFLPVIKSYTACTGIQVEIKDISLAGRIIANFPDNLADEQKKKDALSELGNLAKTPCVNIIKLPNISASIPQLKAVIKELQEYGYDIPDFPEEPKSEQEKKIKARYAKVLGSAVNPVLREGNSDRRVADAVKEYAKANPHFMGEWKSDSKSHVAHMTVGDFYSSEKSVVIERSTNYRIEFIDNSGNKTVLKKDAPLLDGEVIDASVMSCKALCEFYEKEIEAAKKDDVLFSLHLKATMMKVSDPIIFGYAVKVFYKKVFEKYADVFQKIGIEANNGLGDVYAKLNKLPIEQRDEIENAIMDVYKTRPELAMVDFDNGITNLHVPNNVIIDASMPAAIRSSGRMWGKDGKQHDMKAVIPDRCYAGVYKQTINFCKKNGAFDVSTMGTVSNVGLMAQKAEEYGSHDKTFEIKESGIVKVINTSGETLIEHKVEKGDIWRMCQTKDIPIQDWVKLAVNRARKTGDPAVFWLDENRAHDRNLILKVKDYLKKHDTSGLDIRIMNPDEAILISLQRAKDGKDTISVTGNVLRDYLTDLFPIFELGSSSKMLSIVPLLAGGWLFETGAGGTAPDLYNFFIKHNHLTWDSLGEYLALAVSLEELANQEKSEKINILSETLNIANSKYLLNNKAPSIKVNELDNRGSSFYLALYWAEALAEQDKDNELKNKFRKVAEKLKANQELIVKEIIDVQGKKVDIGGYYYSDPLKTEKAMRPSQVFNNIIDSI